MSKLPFSYLPALVAVSMEPFRALLEKYAYMVIVFEYLNRKGRVSRKSASAINCERIPPQLHPFSPESSLLGSWPRLSLFSNLHAIALGSPFESSTDQTCQ